MIKNVSVYACTCTYRMISPRKDVLKFEKLNAVFLHSLSSPLRELPALRGDKFHKHEGVLHARYYVRC